MVENWPEVVSQMLFFEIFVDSLLSYHAAGFLDFFEVARVRSKSNGRRSALCPMMICATHNTYGVKCNLHALASENASQTSLQMSM